jgi:hypothetical protein
VGNSFYNNNTQYTELAEQGTLLAEVEALAAEVQADLETVQGYLSHQVIGGAGLTGAGNLTADVTLAVGAGTGITVNAERRGAYGSGRCHARRHWSPSRLLARERTLA